MAKYLRPDGTVLACLIAPGQGSSAFYKGPQLRRDVDVFEGAHCYIDHPTRTDAKERPERSVRDLAGVVTRPHWREDGPVGPGDYGHVKILDHWKPFVEEIAPLTGFSIRGNGDLVVEKIKGKPTRVAEKFRRIDSVDLVTRAGAGGQAVPFSESAVSTVDAVFDQYLSESGIAEKDAKPAAFIEWLGSRETDEPAGGGDQPMELKEALAKVATQETELATLREAKTNWEKKDKKLTADNGRLSEALALRAARDLVVEAVKADRDMLEATRKRLVETLPKSLDLTDGKLDEDALKAKIAEAVKTEKAYVESLTNPGRITGMGDGKDVAGDKALKEALVESYTRKGMGKEEAEKLADLVNIGR